MTQQYDPSKQPPAFAAFDQFLADTAEVNNRRSHIARTGLLIYGHDDDEFYAFRKAWNTAIELCYDAICNTDPEGSEALFRKIEELRCPL